MTSKWIDTMRMPRWLDKLLTRLWERRSRWFWLVLAACIPGICVGTLVGELYQLFFGRS